MLPVAITYPVIHSPVSTMNTSSGSIARYGPAKMSGITLLFVWRSVASPPLVSVITHARYALPRSVGWYRRMTLIAPSCLMRAPVVLAFVSVSPRLSLTALKYRSGME